jgi:CO/xanthine dehydrogenase FAD-binding subunit
MSRVDGFSAVKLWEKYHLARTVDEALALLANYDGEAQIVAGGTDLLIDLQQPEKAHQRPKALIDVTRIAEMNAIQLEDGVLTIGAAVTHASIVKSALLEQYATCLVESCGVVGGPQVRNVGTLGGNVAHALPAGDGTTSLVALDAEALVGWGDGRREWLPITALFKGAGVSALDSRRDILIAFRFQACKAGEGCAFKRIMRPQGVALPILGCAVWVALEPDGKTIRDARICLAPVSQTPMRAAETEAALRGQPADRASIERAVSAAYETLHPRTSRYRATGEYRREMIGTLLRGALPRAFERAATGQAKAEGVGA